MYVLHNKFEYRYSIERNEEAANTLFLYSSSALLSPYSILQLVELLVVIVNCLCEIETTALKSLNESHALLYLIFLEKRVRVERIV